MVGVAVGAACVALVNVVEFSVPAVRQWAIYAAAMSLLVELSACGSLPPSVTAGAPERPRTVAPMAPTSSGTVGSGGVDDAEQSEAFTRGAEGGGGAA